MANVLLLRSSTADGPDKYEAACTDIGYHAVSVPVLETVLVNLSDLEGLVSAGPVAHALSGVIITSARSCEAWREVVQKLVAQPSATADWTKTPFYAVGQATAISLEQIGEVAEDTLLAPRDIRGGTESGTAEKLAHFILQDLPSDSPGKKLLYLTGDKNRDTLPTILQNGGVQLQALQVYKTQGASGFPAGLRHALKSVPNRTNSWWIVYFAPSAADFVTPILKEHFQIPNIDDKSSSTKVAAIGPTTSTFLRDELCIRVDVLSPKPNPESLASAIKEFDTQ